MVMKNLSAKDIGDSIKRIADGIRNSQIIAFPGGFSGGDEPDGSGNLLPPFSETRTWRKRQ